VEIITQPGIGRSATTRRSATAAAAERPQPVHSDARPEQSKNYMMNLNGTLVPQKASFIFNAEGLNSFETPNIRASTARSCDRRRCGSARRATTCA
jgi:hypothetical protein